MKHTLFLLALALVACQKTSPPPSQSSNSTTPPPSTIKGEFHVGNYTQFNYNDTVGHNQRSHCSFFLGGYGLIGTTLVLVNGDSASYEVPTPGYPVTYNIQGFLPMSGSPSWKVLGDATKGISSGTYTANPIPEIVKIISPDTAHKGHDYSFNYTTPYSDSIFIQTYYGFSNNYFNTVSYGVPNIPSMLTIPSAHLANCSGTVIITSVNYSTKIVNGTTYLFKSYQIAEHKIIVAN